MRRFLQPSAFLIATIVFLISCNRDVLPPPPASDDVETDQYILEPHTVNISTNLPGFYSAVPGHYYKKDLKYPLLIYIHGAGQFGNGVRPSLDAVFNEGTPKLLKSQTFPLSFISGGKHYSFIVLMPQFARSFTTSDMKAFYDYALAHYRVDSSRIYLSGFSLGGLMTSEFGAGYPLSLAAMTPMAGEATSNLAAKARAIAKNNLAVWVFHNTGDEVYNVAGASNFVNAINSQLPGIRAKLTIFPPEGAGNHDAWTRACNPTYRENNLNIYEWMLQYKR
jgi:predicted peptidase